VSLFSREIELYDFFRGVTHWRYTDIDRPAVVEGLTYLGARGLKRSAIVQSAEESKNNIEVTAPFNLSVLDVFKPFPPMQRIHLKIRRVRVSDGLITEAWNGIASDVEDSNESVSIIRCQTLMAAVNANGLRRNWQVSCPHTLYGRGCGVPQDDFRTDAVLSDVLGTVIKAPQFAAHPDGWFNGGFIRFPDGADVDYRFVLSHVGDTLTLLTPVQLPVGTPVAGFPGCNHLLTGDCSTKFNNELNNGGQHTIPTVNPFGSDPVF
jgi:uncharacterized phage protein (TIGR02218 family)